MTPGGLSRAVWRKSSRCAGSGATDQCVEVAVLDDGRIAMRDSKRPDGAVLVFPRATLAAWISGARNDEFTALS
jgi:hypothetical protein